MSNEAKKIEYEHKPSQGWYRSLRLVVWLLVHTLWPLKIVGKENVPRTGSAIVVSNHLSMIDPFVVCFGAHRLVNFMGKEELFRTPIVGFLGRKLGAFPVDRSRRDAASMRIAFKILKDGEVLGMFPEGTRSTTGEMLELRAGAARLASRTRAPIVPAAVVNTDHALPPGKFVRPARISVIYGEPFELTELYEKPKDEEALARALVLIKEKIEQLHS